MFQKVAFPQKYTVLYDAQCGGCSRAVSWLKRMDKRGQFEYLPLQQKDNLGIPLPDDDSIILLYEEQILLRSEAILKICDILGGPWKVCKAMLAWVPLRHRDFIYSWVAKNRSWLLGKNGQCSL